MELGSAGLSQQPFPTHGQPLSVQSCESGRAALEVLKDTYEHATGLSLLQGPTLSGKSTLVHSFIRTLHEDCEVAIVAGKGLNRASLLLAVLHEFGYSLESDSAKELLGMVRVFALQQAASHEPPLLIIENAHDLKPSALRALCELAELRVQTGSALKIVMVSDRSLRPTIDQAGMEAITKRLLHDFHLRPMTEMEARQNLHDKLRVAGSDYPDFVFPPALCSSLWKASGGWPGILDRLALLALARAETLPVALENVEYPILPRGTWEDADVPVAETESSGASEAPRLILTHSGSLIGELAVDKPRMLIGRSGFNDISLDNRFMSRHHALIVRHGSSTLLVDLNSTNGTFVNAKRVSNHVLLHDDVITVGHHKIKFDDPNATSRGALVGAEFADTAVMRTLEDIRNLLAQEKATLMPAASEDLPNIRS